MLNAAARLLRISFSRSIGSVINALLWRELGKKTDSEELIKLIYHSDTAMGTNLVFDHPLIRRIESCILLLSLPGDEMLTSQIQALKNPLFEVCKSDNGLVNYNC